jgi:predicted PurR-regulated permease PerM
MNLSRPQPDPANNAAPTDTTPAPPTSNTEHADAVAQAERTGSGATYPVQWFRLESWHRWMILGLVLVFLYEARTVIGPFVIAGIIAYIFTGGVSAVQERLHWPRIVVAALLYVLVLVALGILIYFGARALVGQTIDLGQQGPNLVENGLQQFLGNSSIDVFGQHLDAHSIAQRVDQAVQEFQGQPSSALHYGELVIARLLDILLVIIVSFYFIVDGHKLGAYMLKFIPAESRPAAGYLAGRIHTVLGAYIRGQLFLIALMSVITYLALRFLFGLHYALPIAIATGFLEVLPFIGPAAAAALAAGVALAQGGPTMAIGILVLYLILREAEDQLVMPFVVGRAVDLHPLVPIFAVLAGGAIAGVLGVLLAVPTAAAIKVILDLLYPSTPERAISQARPGLARAAREEKTEAQAEKS